MNLDKICLYYARYSDSVSVLHLPELVMKVLDYRLIINLTR